MHPTAGEAVAAAQPPLDPECEKLVAALRKRCPDAFPKGPLKPGQPAPPVPLPVETAQALYNATFAAAAGPPQARAAGGVIWTQSDAELLVRLSKIRVRLLDGLVLVGVPVFCEQTQDVEIVVAFAVGAKDAPAGMVIATESAPRGPAVIVDRWGDALTAAAHQALIALAQSIAGAAGQDVDGVPLLPAALEASPDGLQILPQARHAFDRRANA
jgi:hypothetical protein